MCCISPRTQRYSLYVGISRNCVPSVLRAVLLGREKEGRPVASFVFAWMQIKKWKRNPRVICAFLVLLLLCLTMTSEYVDYSKEIGLSIQVFEPFILMLRSDIHSCLLC